MTSQPVTRRFPEPNTPELARAYSDLHLAATGSNQDKNRLGDPALLPRPWDPPTCTKESLRRELWRWLDAFVDWFNHEYTWDLDAGMIPPCWPQHPHLVHEIAVLADQRRRAGKDLTSSSMEEWHRYCVPAFYDRLKARTGKCGGSDHQTWPAQMRYDRDLDAAHRRERDNRFADDVTGLVATSPQKPSPEPPGRPQLSLVTDDGQRIDPVTGEVIVD